MRRVTADEAQRNLEDLLEETAEAGEPIVITGSRSDAVLLSSEDWRSIDVALHRLQHSKEGIPLEDLVRELGDHLAESLAARGVTEQEIEEDFRAHRRSARERR